MARSRTVTRTAAAMTLLACAACGGPITDMAAKGSATTRTPSVTATATPSPGGGPAQLEATYEQVIKKVLPSIVQITTSQGLGSGIIYDKDGHILTNAHVVGGEEELSVTLATGGKKRTARLLNVFPAGDLAVIKVDNTQGLTPASFGRSSDLKVGQIVLAMGNPLGYSGSVTQGIVSALGRTVSGSGGQGTPSSTIPNAIQTSAPINPGNSGGALVDLTGHVIGIPTLAAVSPELGAAPGIGFAIPSDTATDIASQIVKHGKVVNSHRAALGVQVGTAVDALGSPVGVLVGRLTRGGSADKAGIRTGDVIVSIDGTPTPDATTLTEVLARHQPGDTVKVKLLYPSGRESTVPVTLGELSG
ncbi:trypsin-like peptidase domain-containing protein [Microtetraspora sp. AC03309]|uniref:S1C family serine protease n=1 Tax=Microtetraspora sp. AC03309 TaxID=2779376 RepID=UPI001E4B2502|nr:trypsin-like peptidase domain-containing protein [Microtetraspora sp. AC03309]MCC5579822.1 trypsin-like peptidase domain-containing protein [Microtetraspora sp. AC03309]